MSDHIRYYGYDSSVNAVVLPIDIQKIINDWAALRTRMVRKVPDTFTRDEWAYLVTFLDPESLSRAFLDAFGKEIVEPPAYISRLYRPRGQIAVWLPNNVSLLGPLTLVLLSLTGQQVGLKLGSSAKDLAGEFLRFTIENLGSGQLREYLANSVSAERFDRTDPRQASLARDSQVRIVFGSDQAAHDIHALPHPLGSAEFSFTDRQSEAWIEKDVLDDNALVTLIKAFAIYGQAGCTSPRRLVLLDGSPEDLPGLADRLADLWPTVIKQDAAMHVASSNVLADQHARALGWRTRKIHRNAALLAYGPLDMPRVDASMVLTIHAATREEALAALPDNIQTIGHHLNSPDDPIWLQVLARSRVLRFVPLGQVHYFNNSWDGCEFWRQCFEAVEVKI